MKRRNPARKQPDSVQTIPAEKAAALQSALAEILAESWRFEHALEKVMRRMDVMEAERFGRQYGYFSSRVRQAMSAAGMTCLELTGQPYDVGMPVQAVNLDEFGEEEPLIITQMIEPVILCDGRVMKTGMVTLGRTAEES